LDAKSYLVPVPISRKTFLPIILTAVFLGGFIPSASAQDSAKSPWLDRTWETDDGLPDNNVTGVVQASDGYLWVATFGGLLRFNGTQFEQYPLAHLPNVPNRVVRKIFLDRHEQLWLGLDRGVIVRVSSNKAKVFTPDDGLPDSRPLVLAEDREGAVWLATANSFYRITGDKVTAFGDDESWPGGQSWLAADSTGQIWFARGTHIGIVDAERGGWREILQVASSPLRLAGDHSGGLWISTATEILHYQSGGELKSCALLPDKSVVSALWESHDGALWIGTETDGLLRLQNGRLEHIPTSHPEINSLYEDRENNLWTGTGGGGLNLLCSQAIHLLGKKDGLPGDSVRSICQDTSGELWAAMNNGLLAHGHDDQWIAATSADGWPGGNATCVAAARSGGIWIGTRDRGLQLLQAGKLTEWGLNQTLGGAWVRSLLAASSGDLWIATVNPNQLLRFAAGKFDVVPLPGEVRSLRALTECPDGTIWVGSSDGQLFSVHGLSVSNVMLNRESRPLSIRALHAAADGSLWIGYAGWGIGRLHDGHYARITTKEGMFDDYISQILADGRGNLWLTCNHGLFEMREQELSAVAEGHDGRVRPVVFGKNEGLPNIQPSWDDNPSVCRTAQGQLWFATHNGLLAVEPSLIADNPLPPPMLLEHVAVDDALVAVRGARSPLRGPTYTNTLDLSAANPRLRLAPSHRKIEFDFTALNFRSPENIHFRYRLKNFDNAWVEVGTQRSAKYPQLPAGDYEFQVQACNNAGEWGEPGVGLKLTVSPFFWQQWWFRTSGLLAFTGCVIGLVRYFSFRRLRRELFQLERQAELQRERARIARDIHDEVGSKLSRLTLLSEMAGQQPDASAAAQAEAAEISETARDTIRSFEEIVWAVNPKNDSLPQLMNYLCRFAEEFFDGSPTQCVFDVPAQIPTIELPVGARHQIFLSAKEALNNVFKHAQARRVCLRLAQIENGFEIVIEDDGQGMAENQPLRRVGTGNGMGNMRDRMKQIGGELKIQSQAGKGTRIILCLSLALPPAG
jgi:signal transduction histidine kinase/ligand-binding sensor domain-containing protein